MSFCSNTIAHNLLQLQIFGTHQSTFMLIIFTSMAKIFDNYKCLVRDQSPFMLIFLASMTQNPKRIAHNLWKLQIVGMHQSTFMLILLASMAQSPKSVSLLYLKCHKIMEEGKKKIEIICLFSTKLCSKKRYFISDRKCSNFYYRQSSNFFNVRVSSI